MPRTVPDYVYNQLGEVSRTRFRPASQIHGRIAQPAIQGGAIARVRLDGVESTIEHLRIIGEKDVANEVRKFIRANLKPVLAAARADAPVRSGLLRRRTAIIATLKRSGIRARTDQDSSKDYAGPIHWGWPGPDRNARARNIPRNAFIWDNWQRGQRQFVRDVDRDLRAWARRAERRLNRTVRVGTSQVVS